jgi:hypothetical protein
MSEYCRHGIFSARICEICAEVIPLERELAAERKRAAEAIRRLQYMHSAHSDSVQWYQNAIAQALNSLGALPEKLDFDEAMK